LAALRLVTFLNATFLSHSCSGGGSLLLISFKPTEHEGDKEMRQNHSAGKRLGIFATGISAAAIVAAAVTGAAVTHWSAASPGPQWDSVPAAMPAPWDSGISAATPDPQQEAVLAAAPDPQQEGVSSATPDPFEE
jgi:hypothetical protein